MRGTATAASGFPPGADIGVPQDCQKRPYIRARRILPARRGAFANAVWTRRMTGYHCRFVSCIEAGYYVALALRRARMTVRDKQQRADAGRVYS